jgi:Holliday junction resolvasome RuvABC DNA-binding subunit
MAWKSKDGQQFTNRMSQKMHDASMGDSKPAAKAMPDIQSANDPGADNQPKITDNPAAMKLVDQLQQMGYTADDVSEAMGGMDQEASGGQEAAQAAPMQIPGTM